jgi:hypothetical protein
MKIFTSYFGNLKTLVESGVAPMSIALWKPRFFTGICLYNVAPLKYMLKDDLSMDEYIEAYINKVLANVDANSFVGTLVKLSDGRDVALCCYEKPTDFCHRHLLAKWITEQTGIQVNEFVKERIQEKKEAYTQMSLF